MEAKQRKKKNNKKVFKGDGPQYVLKRALRLKIPPCFQRRRATTDDSPNSHRLTPHATKKKKTTRKKKKTRMVNHQLAKYEINCSLQQIRQKRSNDGRILCTNW
jgi:hypothetical protein